MRKPSFRLLFLMAGNKKKPRKAWRKCHKFMSYFYSSFFIHHFLFIGLRGINGSLTAFLGLLTDFKRKLDLSVVAIPPKAGALRR